MLNAFADINCNDGYQDSTTHSYNCVPAFLFVSAFLYAILGAVSIADRPVTPASKFSQLQRLWDTTMGDLHRVIQLKVTILVFESLGLAFEERDLENISN